MWIWSACLYQPNTLSRAQTVFKKRAFFAAFAVTRRHHPILGEQHITVEKTLTDDAAILRTSVIKCLWCFSSKIANDEWGSIWRFIPRKRFWIWSVVGRKFREREIVSRKKSDVVVAVLSKYLKHYFCTGTREKNCDDLSLRNFQMINVTWHLFRDTQFI